MSQFQKAMLVVLVVTVGVWGCAQGSSGKAAAERVRTLEQKVTLLEEDFRAAASARDQFRKKLGESEQLTAQLKQEVEALRVVVKERDELRVTLRTRTQERDALSAQFDGFRKSLRDLLGQMDAAAKTATPPITTVSQPKGPNL